jgi:hypothetical protein
LGSTASGTTSTHPADGYKFGSVFTLAKAGTTIDFKFCAAGGTAAQRFTPLIYNVGADRTPTTLVTKGASVTVAARKPAAWITSTLPRVPLAPGSYMLALLAGPADAGAKIYYRTVTDRQAGQFNENVYPYVFPTPPFDWGETKYENHLDAFNIDYSTSESRGAARVTPAAVRHNGGC